MDKEERTGNILKGIAHRSGIFLFDSVSDERLGHLVKIAFAENKNFTTKELLAFCQKKIEWYNVNAKFLARYNEDIVWELVAEQGYNAIQVILFDCFADGLQEAYCKKAKESGMEGNETPNKKYFIGELTGAKKTDD